MSEDKIQNLKTDQQVMAEQIKNIDKNQKEIKKTLADYIEEDRKWKRELPVSLEKKYATKQELEHVKYIISLLIACAGAVAMWVLYTRV